MTLTKAFIVFGGDIPPVTLVAVEGRQQWHRDVLPNLKRAVTALVGHRVSWDDFWIDSIDADDPVMWFLTRPYFTRITLHANRTHTIEKPNKEAN